MTMNEDVLTAITRHEWIDAKCALPEPIHPDKRCRYNSVLVYTPWDDMIRVAWYLGKDYRGIHTWIVPSARNGYKYLTQTVSHWQTLPKVPWIWN